MARQSQFVCEPMTGPNARSPNAPPPDARAESHPEREDLFQVTELPWPEVRPLQVYAFDPSVGKFVGNYMTASVRYEKLQPGPVGERFAVIDYDGTTKTYYKPVDLDDPKLLIAEALIRAIPIRASISRWSMRWPAKPCNGSNPRWAGAFTGGFSPNSADLTPKARVAASQCLNLFPHAMCQANAFYNPDVHGIVFGYFKASRTDPGRNLPGQTVFTCLSHDIIAHETTHAIVDGIREYFMEPTNIDVPAFHEAFADLAALFAHFTHKEVLLDTLQKTGGRLFNQQLNLSNQQTNPKQGQSAMSRPAEDDGQPVIQAQLAAPIR